MKGQGSLDIQDGMVFMNPLFDGLSRLMTKIVPGLSFGQSQNNATCDFVIGEGRIHSDKITVAGDVLSLEGKGAYRLSDELDFSIKLKLLKDQALLGRLVQELTSPLSMLFEFTLRGPTERPEWYLSNAPKGLLKKLGFNNSEEIDSR